MDEFRSLVHGRIAAYLELGRFLRDCDNLLDPAYMLDLYRRSVEAEKAFAVERKKRDELVQLVKDAAAARGCQVFGIETPGKTIPDKEMMDKAIEAFRQSYLVALMAKTLPELVEQAEQGKNGMSLYDHSEKRRHSTGYSSWSTMNRRYYIVLPCDEKPTDKEYIVRSDIVVTEWKGEGYGQSSSGNGEWRTDLPSAWDHYPWPMPRAAASFAEILWKDAEVPCKPYDDFRHIFFPVACGGSYHGDERYWESLYPRPWNNFNVLHDTMQRKIPWSRMEWMGRKHITEVRLTLSGDGECKRCDDD